jgi:fructose-specific component phosphotransferase system IIB-like protein
MTDTGPTTDYLAGTIGDVTTAANKRIYDLAVEMGLDPDQAVAKLQGSQPKTGKENDQKSWLRQQHLGDLKSSARAKQLTDRGMSSELAVEVLKNTNATHDNTHLQFALKQIAVDKEGSALGKAATAFLSDPKAQAAGIVAPSTASPGGIQNGAGGAFNPSGAVTNGSVDDAFLAALRNKAKNFLTADQINYLGSTGSPDSFLNAIGGPGGSDEAALAMNTLARNTGGASGVPAEGDITASATQVQLSPTDTSDNADAMIPTGSRLPKSKWIDPNQPLHGGKTVTEAIKLLRELPTDQLQNLQRKLVDAGYIARVATGSTTEPDAWGDPTDPLTNAAWRALLTDTIAQGSDVQTMLANGAATFAPKLAELQKAKADAAQAKALHDALMNQVQVTSMDSLRSAVSKLNANGQMLGHDLNPDEVTNLGQWIQQLQSSQQLAQQHGSSWVPQVDPVASLEQRIKSDHPVEFLGQQTADAAETWAKLLKTPGAA